MVMFNAIKKTFNLIRVVQDGYRPTKGGNHNNFCALC